MSSTYNPYNSYKPQFARSSLSSPYTRSLRGGFAVDPITIIKLAILIAIIAYIYYNYSKLRNKFNEYKSKFDKYTKVAKILG